MKLQFTVNNKPYTYDTTDKDVTLLVFLRNVLRMTGTKNGCAEGHCGACTVVVDGKSVLACKTKLADIDGRSVTTIEALSDEKRVHAIVYSFSKEGAVQCGFCTPGFIMSVKALLDGNPDPDDEAIRKALTGNICRCTGYVKIAKAVRTAASLIRSGKEWIDRGEIFPDRAAVIGEEIIRVDAVEKASGKTIFADDLVMEGMLYTKVLRSEKPHADILDINISEAEKSGGVVKIILAADIPGTNSFGPIKKDQEVLVTSRVRYTGDALAAVFAETEEQAEAAVGKIRVEYRELPVLTGYDEALAEDAFQLHNDGSKNIIAVMESGRGNIEEGFSKAHLVMEREFNTQYIEHAYIEPESCVALVDEDGILTVHVASQGPPMDIGEMSPVVNLPPEKIRIAGMPMGGGFGGKEDISVQIIAALGTLATGRPVKYTFTRRESIKTSGKRNAARLRYKVGVGRDGEITAVKADITAKGGAYASVEEAVILRSVSFAAGPYTIPASEVKARAVYQNHAPTCAMRGFGNPVVTFAAETTLNMIADELSIDPFELRLRNCLEVGKPTVTGDRIPYSVGIKDCLLEVRAALADYKMPKPREGWKIGVGIACSYKNVGLGIGMDDSAGAWCDILEDGSIMLRVGSVDMGQGANSTMAQIFSAELGWPFSRIRVHSADTKADPGAGMTTASRQTFVSGNAVLGLAKKMKVSIQEFIAGEFGVEPDDIELAGGFFKTVRDEKVLLSLNDFISLIKERKLTFHSENHYTAPTTHFSLREPKAGYTSEGHARLHAAYCFAAQATVLEVNPSSGKVKVHDVFIASDAGKMINKAAVEGQMEGGIVMGLGYALSEEYKEENGVVITDTYARLGLRRIGETPNIHCMVVENTHADGPFGAKGMSELPISTGAASVVHAIHNAIGVWMTSLPVLPEKIRAAAASK